MIKNIVLIFALILPTLAWSADLRGRMGVGFSNQLANGIPAISFKVQQTKTFALGGMIGFKSDQDDTLYGAGLKMYRVIFDEPQLNFYMAGLLAAENFVDDANEVQSGFQMDGTLGSEFHFQGLESLGFSIEFGVSVRKVSDSGTSFETLGDSLIKAAVHFYL